VKTIKRNLLFTIGAVASAPSLAPPLAERQMLEFCFSKTSSAITIMY
jgi:hypothetical protein